MHTTTQQIDLKDFFTPFRAQIIGQGQKFNSPYGPQQILYADWTASGRLYRPIEEKLINEFGPFVANTHTETNVTGTAMTMAYHEARHIIKQHVNTSKDDVLIMAGSGMTGAIAKLQRILGLKVPEQHRGHIQMEGSGRPVVFITHMEHHSNHTSWLETLAEVVPILPDESGYINLDHFEALLDQYKNRSLKIASITAGSNVTGIQSCYREVARRIHAADGYCFVDYACAGPYVPIDMHPADEAERLDAIYFSPHKFLGGPGTPGILVFNRSLYRNRIPDVPGGGTVTWTNPWGEHQYVADIEAREDGGTPAFLQTIKAALAIRLKEEMGVDRMMTREKPMVHKLMSGLKSIPGVHVLADHIEERLGVISFYVENLHFNLGVKLLNDRFGIQTRGGCSCAGTYGHYLLNISKEKSKSITNQIDAGLLSVKPGWIRASIHPVMTDEEIDQLLHAIEAVANQHMKWERDYTYSSQTNEFTHFRGSENTTHMVQRWFQF
ncbi:MAG: aminotransferase class V-fold PLP-dependent enzyme [Bacteroidota bacterium]